MKRKGTAIGSVAASAAAVMFLAAPAASAAPAAATYPCPPPSPAGCTCTASPTCPAPPTNRAEELLQRLEARYPALTGIITEIEHLFGGSGVGNPPSPGGN
jgi:hypothetical protein